MGQPLQLILASLILTRASPGRSGVALSRPGSYRSFTTSRRTGTLLPYRPLLSRLAVHRQFGLARGVREPAIEGEKVQILEPLREP